MNRNRAFFAHSVAAALGIGAMLTSVQASARAGGFAGGHAAFGPGVMHSFRPPFVGQLRPPSSALPAAPRSGARPGPFAVGGPRARFGRFFGFGRSLAGAGGYYGYGDYDGYGGYGDNGDYGGGPYGFYQQPDYYPVPEYTGSLPPFAANRGGCWSQSTVVPSEAAGHEPVTVTITRC